MKEDDKEKLKNLFGNEEVPEELKKEVFDSLESIRLFGNIFDLFTDKFIRTEGSLFSPPQKEDEDEFDGDMNTEHPRPKK